MSRTTVIAGGVSLLVFLAAAAIWLSYWTPHPIQAGLPGSSGSVGGHFGLNPDRRGVHVGVFYPHPAPRPSWPKWDESAFMATFKHLPQPGSAHLAGFYLFWRSPAFLNVGGTGRTEYLGCGYSLILPAWFLLGGSAILPASVVIRWRRLARHRSSRGFEVQSSGTTAVA